MEFSGLLRFSSRVRKLDWPVEWARSAESDGRQFWMVSNGAGARHAAKATDVALAGCRPEAIVSMGFCGALDPALKIGDIVDGRSSTIVTLDRVARTAEEKAALRAKGAMAVEMEAAGVAERAAHYGIPFFCIKAVTDLAAQSFTVDFNQALRSDGHFATMGILKSASHNPWKAFPELFRLSRSCRIATRSLGEFIAGCRF